MDSNDLARSRAESLYAGLLLEHADPSEESLQRLCGQHPELAEELLGLHQRLQSAGGALARRATPSGERAVPPIDGPLELGQFRCLRLLGRGGMGEVWEAEDRQLHRRVAIKLLQTGWVDGEAQVLRLQREAQAAGRVSHPGIVAVLQTGAWQGRHFIVQELVPGGRTLRDEIERLHGSHELPPDHDRIVAERFLRLARALQAAHDAGIVHRDMKPQNVLLTPEGAPKIADFGLALLESELPLTRTGDFMGTYLYASPEQIEGRRGSIDERSDIYSLGATLYENLTLARPFHGDSVREVMRAILESDPEPPHLVRRRIARDLSHICSKALEKRPEDRYSSMAALAEDLRRFLAHETILARPPSPAQRALKWVRRHPTLATALTIFASASISLAALFLHSERLRGEADLANQGLRELTEELRQEGNLNKEVVDFLIAMFESAYPEVTGKRVPSVREVVELGADRIEAGDVKDALVKARLLDVLSTALIKLGSVERATRLLEEALAIHEQLGSSESLTAALSTLSLAGRYQSTGDTQRALRLLEPLAARVGESQEFDEKIAVDTIMSLAELYCEGREFDRCRELLDRSDALMERLGRAQEEHRGRLLYDRALLAWRRGDYEEAEQEAQGLLSGYQEEIARGNPRALKALNLLGLIQMALQKLDDAEATFLDARAAVSETLPPEHPSVLVAQNNVATVWCKQGRLEEAEATLMDAIALYREHYGADEPGIAELLASLGHVHVAQKRWPEAEEAFRESATCREKAFGRGDNRTVEVLSDLAAVVSFQGRIDEALALTEEVVAHTPPGHPLQQPRFQFLERLRTQAAEQR